MKKADLIDDERPALRKYLLSKYNDIVIPGVLEAFKIYGLDCLFKRFERKRLEKAEWEAFQKYKEDKKNKGGQLVIKCFGEFQIGWEGADFIKWRTQKTMELFAFLLHNYGKNVSKYRIIDAVWPDIEPEKAEHQLYNGIYYIRKVLKEYNVPRENILISDKYCLRVWNVDFDLERLNKYLTSNVSALPVQTLQEIEEKYTRDYFENCDWPWVEYDRNFYSRQLYKISLRLSEIYLENRDFEKAERVLSKTVKSNPYEEKPVFLLMKTYLLLSDKFKAIELYNAYKDLLKKDLGIFPSGELADYTKLITD